jgi:hypothetical protein
MSNRFSKFSRLALLLAATLCVGQAHAQSGANSSMQIGATVVRSCATSAADSSAARLPAGNARHAALVEAARSDLLQTCDATVAEATRVLVIDARVTSADVLEIQF